MIPVRISFEVPEWAENANVSERWHNRTVKEILRDELQKHLAVRIPKHFEYAASGRYGYAKRTDKYQRTKNKYRGRTVGKISPVTYAPDSNLSLVKTGRTRREISSGAKITVSGTGSRILGTLRMKVPIPGSTGRDLSLAAQLRMLANKGGRRKFMVRKAAQQKMEIVRRTLNEIERFAPDEVREINSSVAALYHDALKRARRVKKKQTA